MSTKLDSHKWFWKIAIYSEQRKEEENTESLAFRTLLVRICRGRRPHRFHCRVRHVVQRDCFAFKSTVAVSCLGKGAGSLQKRSACAITSSFAVEHDGSARLKMQRRVSKSAAVSIVTLQVVWGAGGNHRGSGCSALQSLLVFSLPLGGAAGAALKHDDDYQDNDAGQYHSNDNNASRAFASRHLKFVAARCRAWVGSSGRGRWFGVCGTRACDGWFCSGEHARILGHEI